MSGGLFLSERHPSSGRTATLDDTGACAWLTLSEPGGLRIAADAWVYNRVPAPPFARVASYRPEPPPAAEGYAGSNALCEDPSAHRWRLRWSADGESVAVERDGAAVALIARAGRPGFSAGLARSGPWGAVWDEAACRATLGNSEV